MSLGAKGWLYYLISSGLCILCLVSLVSFLLGVRDWSVIPNCDISRPRSYNIFFTLNAAEHEFYVDKYYMGETKSKILLYLSVF